MILQPVFSIFPFSTPSGTFPTPGLSIPWCCLHQGQQHHRYAVSVLNTDLASFCLSFIWTVCTAISAHVTDPVSIGLHNMKCRKINEKGQRPLIWKHSKPTTSTATTSTSMTPHSEIKVPSGENTELKGSPFKARSRSVYSHTCYGYCQGFLSCLLLPFRSIYLHFFQNLSRFFSCVGWGQHRFLRRRAE